MAADLVVLDWSAVENPLYPRDTFEPLDLSAFSLSTGGTLADDPEAFKERVRLQVTRIYCDSFGPTVRVVHARDAERAEDVAGTTVYFTQVLSPMGGSEIGEGDYDPCNVQHDNAAVIFGEQISRLGSSYSFDEWVLLFANVTAHEIGHTLGYAHVGRDEPQEPGRRLYVELMLAGHTLAELRREQRFTVDQSTCSSERERSRRLDEYRTFSYAPVLER